MNYQTTSQEKYAEAHAQARLDRDGLLDELRTVTTHERHLENRLSATKAKKMHTTAGAHAGLDVLAERAGEILAVKVEPWINSLLQADPVPPSGDIAATWLLQNETFVADMHAEIDRAGASPKVGYITTDIPEELDAQIVAIGAELAEARSAVEDTKRRLKKASERFDEFENGRGRIAA